MGAASSPLFTSTHLTDIGGRPVTRRASSRCASPTRPSQRRTPTPHGVQPSPGRDQGADRRQRLGQLPAHAPPGLRLREAQVGPANPVTKCIFLKLVLLNVLLTLWLGRYMLKGNSLLVFLGGSTSMLYFGKSLDVHHPSRVRSFSRCVCLGGRRSAAAR